MQRYPQRFEAYWQALEQIDSQEIQIAVNRMAKTPALHLAWFIDLFRREQFLRSYENDAALLHRLNQVLVRVKLTPIPNHAVEVVSVGRSMVQQRIFDLLPVEKFRLPAFETD